jgi:hypothetical protein
MLVKVQVELPCAYAPQQGLHGEKVNSYALIICTEFGSKGQFYILAASPPPPPPMERPEENECVPQMTSYWWQTENIAAHTANIILNKLQENFILCVSATS